MASRYCGSGEFDRLTMMGRESRQLNKGDRVVWSGDSKDGGTVTERDWAGVTIKMGQPTATKDPA